jgi:hypothetical protein
MTTEYNSRSAIGQLCLCPKGISSKIRDNSTSSESLVELLLNTNIRPKELLEFCVKSLMPLTALFYNNY